MQGLRPIFKNSELKFPNPLSSMKVLWPSFSLIFKKETHFLHHSWADAPKQMLFRGCALSNCYDQLHQIMWVSFRLLFLTSPLDFKNWTSPILQGYALSKCCNNVQKRNRNHRAAKYHRKKIFPHTTTTTKLLFLRWISYVVHLLKHDDKQELFLRIGFVSEMIRLSLAWMSETKYMFVCLFFFFFLWREWKFGVNGKSRRERAKISSGSEEEENIQNKTKNDVLD